MLYYANDLDLLGVGVAGCEAIEWEKAGDAFQRAAGSAGPTIAALAGLFLGRLQSELGRFEAAVVV